MMHEELSAFIKTVCKETPCSETSPKIVELRSKALCDLADYLCVFAEAHLMPSLIETVCKKKIAFIMQATSQGTMREIMKSPQPVWTGGGLICRSNYYIPEEELLMWAYVSPNNNLKPEAYARYMQLFEEIMGISVRGLMDDARG